MKTPREAFRETMTRRQSLKLSGLALGGLALGRRAAADCVEPSQPCYPTADETQRYSYYDSLPTIDYRQTPKPPGTVFSPPSDTPPLEPDEMRIIFMGSCIPPVRRAQAMMSIFVEVGWDEKTQRPLDHFIFDCGSGCVRNYGSMGVGFNRMDKIFVNHLHGDHMSDLTHIYCFGPSLDRLSPLYVWGPGPSGVRSPVPPYKRYSDGTKSFCQHLREALRWHSESFSFQNTSYKDFEPPTRRSWGLPHEPVPVSDDAEDDGFAMVPIQLDWRRVGGVAYDNRTTGVKVTHFPVIHCRRGSLGYKLEWNGLSMIYTSDTKPEYNTIIQAANGGVGVDVLVHEMIVPPEIWAMEASHYDRPIPKGANPAWDNAVNRMIQVQNSSHTPQGGFGYLLSQIHPRPRLTVATHFPVADDTISCALRSVNKHCPDISADIGKLGEQALTWSFDLMVLRVRPGRPIEKLRAQVNEFGFSPIYTGPKAEDLNTPRYHDANGDGDPFAQIDTSASIVPGADTYCEDGY